MYITATRISRSNVFRKLPLNSGIWDYIDTFRSIAPFGFQNIVRISKHTMFNIDSGSFEPFMSVNDKPPKRQKHRPTIHNASPIHINWIGIGSTRTASD